MIPDVLLRPLARIGAEALPLRLREDVQRWGDLTGEQQAGTQADVEALAGAVGAGRG